MKRLAFVVCCLAVCLMGSAAFAGTGGKGSPLGAGSGSTSRGAPAATRTAPTCTVTTPGGRVALAPNAAGGTVWQTLTTGVGCTDSGRTRASLSRTHTVTATVAGTATATASVAPSVVGSYVDQSTGPYVSCDGSLIF
jgi:hypothetical protein